MLRNISNLGTTLSKNEQKNINGGWIYIICSEIHCYEPLPRGYICMNEIPCGIPY